MKGARRLGVRLGNWLTVDRGRRLLHTEVPLTLRGETMGLELETVG